MTDAQVYAGAAAMGAVAGMRTLSGPAMLLRAAKSGLQIADREIGVLSHPAAAKTATALAAAEFIADKLPFLPKRTGKAPLTGRAVSGALSGAAVCSARKRSIFVGALLGAAAAIGTAYGVYHLRKKIVERFHWPDPIVALAEDALVAGCGMLVMSKLRSAGVVEQDA